METTKTKTKPNLSLFYVLPMIDVSVTHFDKCLINTFIHNDDFPQREYTVSVLTDHTVSYDIVTASNDFVTSYSPTPENYMFVYEIPEKFRPDYDRFIKGKYSKFSENYKERLRKLYPLHKEQKIDGKTYYIRFKNRVIFDPEIDDFKNKAEELGVTVAQIQEVGEILQIPSTEKETFKSPLSSDTI